jgi:6-phosphogluconolactonase
LDDADQVGARIRKIVQEAAQEAIAQRGHFALAIPGGSILKMLVDSGVDGSDWTSQTTLVYVNHKCVPMDDDNLATHAKATKLFLKDWKGVNVLLMDGTDDGPAEAKAYETKLRNLPSDVLPVRDGLPVFDLALIGVGDDGHIGSLYPDRDEVLVGPDGPWVLSVDMKHPPSITLSLPVMAGAKQVVVAACGVSDKYPQGKSAGMKRAIVDEQETLTTFPAVGLRGVAKWVMDRAAASKLGDVYNRN